MNEITRNRPDASALLMGLVLIAVGTLFLLDRLHVANFGWILHHYWPLVTVACGVSYLIRGRIWAGLWFMTIGLWLQLIVLHVFDLTFGSSWPLLIMAYGLGMIVRAAIDSAKRREPRAPEGGHGS